MIVELVNPKLVFIGNGMSIQTDLKAHADDSQIKRKIEKALMNTSIMCDDIKINRKKCNQQS